MALSLALAVFTYQQAQTELEREVFAKLRAFRETKATQIESTFELIENEVTFLANNRLTAEALVDFRGGFLEAEPTGDITVNEVNVERYYEDEFFPRLVTPPGTEPPDPKDLAPGSPTATVLQDLYIASNAHPVGSKDQLDGASIGTRYDSVHFRYHDSFRNFLETSGFYDLFLVDNDGNVVYTVFKEIDYATNLEDGPHADSGLGEVVRGATDGEVNVVDFDPYVPSYNQPASFFASPVYLSGRRVGTVVVQAPIDEINSVMTNDGRWEAVGLGASGETYLVADDGTMRNDSRFLVEDREALLAALQESSEFSEETIDSIAAFESSIGLQPVDTDGTQAAFEGDTGETIFPDYRGVPVLSSFRPLALSGLDWVIMSEIDEAEAFAAANDLRTTTILVLLGGGLVLGASIVWFSRRLSKPLHELEGVAGELAEYDFTSDVPYQSATLTQVGRRRDEIGELAQTFDRMGGEMTESVRRTLEAIEAREAIESELNVASEIQMSMLPLTFPTFPEHTEFAIHARLIPAKEVGGDFYEFGFVNQDQFFFCVGDVSGKGVPSALFMAATKTLIRSGAMQGEKPSELLTRINTELSRENPEFMFATIWLGVLDLRNGEVAFSNGGHNPPLIRSNGEIEWVHDRHGPIVGPIRGTTYGHGSLHLTEGDLLVLYSDGVTEAMSPDGELYGEDLLEGVIVSTDNKVEDVTERVIDQVLAWEQGGTRSDDVTVLAIRYIAARSQPHFSLTIPIDSDYVKSVSKLNSDFLAFAIEKGISDSATRKLQIALDEMLGNVASYSGASALTMRVWYEGSRLLVELSDDGIPFNPFEEVAKADTTSSLEDRALGGLGVHLVKEMMDEVEYDYRGGHNIVTIVKTFAADTPSP